ncbi:MAG TPA: fumarylacetoacetate hydrolase family protein [Saprospiraceae bacterium]|nr:fumarylacetoacetate hydrolase family protein [Saprospiraceae bacterium]
MNIFCIGRNYGEHIKELNNQTPENPVVFCKPNSAALTDNKAFYYPDFSTDIHYEVEVLFKIARPGKRIQASQALDYISQIGLGIDFTARDLQSQCKSKGLPWEIAKAFDHSAVIGQWINIENTDLRNLNFSLQKNKQVVQQGNTKDMMFSIEQIIEYLSRFFKLNTGDILFTGTPAGVGPIAVGDLLEGFLECKQMFSCEIK